MVGNGWWVHTKGKVKAMPTLKQPNGPFSPSHITHVATKQLNPWPSSSASCVVNYRLLSACQGNMEPFKGYPSTHGHLKSLRNKPQQIKRSVGNFQHRYLTELLVNVYSYHLMVKSVSCCCGHRIQSWFFSTESCHIGRYIHIATSYIS